jgi:hypothetical protein
VPVTPNGVRFDTASKHTWQHALPQNGPGNVRGSCVQRTVPLPLLHTVWRLLQAFAVSPCEHVARTPAPFASCTKSLGSCVSPHKIQSNPSHDCPTGSGTRARVLDCDKTSNRKLFILCMRTIRSFDRGTTSFAAGISKVGKHATVLSHTGVPIKMKQARASEDRHTLRVDAAYC